MMKGKRNNKNNPKPTKKVPQSKIGSLGFLLQSALKMQKEESKTNKEISATISASTSTSKLQKSKHKAKTIYPEIPERAWKKNNSIESFKINVSSSSVITQTTNIKSEEYYFSQISENFIGESELIIGLDFGTSCTKAIIRDNSLQIAYAVPFKGLEEINQLYLISTKLFVSHIGVCSLKNGNGDEIIDDAKIQLMDNPNAIVFTDNRTNDEITALEVSIAYIALILREVRYWFFETHIDKYKNKELLWELNIGLPSRSYDDKLLHETFKLVALAGWNVSTLPGKISLDIVRRVLKQCRQNLSLLGQNKAISIEDGQIHPESVNAFPEVIAEMVGYAKSPSRGEGLHLLIDVGGSTVDIYPPHLKFRQSPLTDDLEAISQ